MADDSTTSESPTGPYRRRRAAPSIPGLAPKPRVGRACDRCREMRARCSGGVRCAKCTRDNAVCGYSDSKRQKDQRDFVEAVDQVSALRKLNTQLSSALRELTNSPDFQPGEHPKVVELLESITSMARFDSPPSYPDPELLQEVETPGGQAIGAESQALRHIGSPRDQQELPHTTSLNHGAGLAGYVGQLSEASWMQRAREYLVGQAPLLDPDVNANRFDYHILQTMDLTYFMDDSDVLSTGEEDVGQYQLPPLPSALIMTEAYFHSLQGAFFFVERDSFINELISESSRTSRWLNRRFLALANMMWALGAKWLEISGLDHDNISEGHGVYYARARALGLDHRIHLDHPNVQLVLGTALLGFYMMINGSIQRAWCITGQAVRYATALGLHLRVATEAISEKDHKSRARIWHSVYRLEVLLSEMAGRPKCINTANVSVPIDLLSHDDVLLMSDSSSTVESRDLWLQYLGKNCDVATTFVGGMIPWKRAGSVGAYTTEKHFVAALKLTKIADQIEDKLYLAPQERSWFGVQMTIGALEELLRAWQDSLPVELRVGSIAEMGIDPRIPLELEMYRCSVGMILYRPCLCDIDREGQSASSRASNLRYAKACVAAALGLLDVMPDDPVASYIHQVLPWWAILHYICQAATVLLLELCLNAQHVQEETRTVIQAISKAMGYLRCFSAESKSAYKAWSILLSLLQKVMPRYSAGALQNMPTDAQKPDRWNETDETMLQVTLQALQ